MANQKISQLTAGSPAQPGDLIPVARSGTNVSILGSSFVLTTPTADQTIVGSHALNIGTNNDSAFLSIIGNGIVPSDVPPGNNSLLYLDGNSVGGPWHIMLHNLTSGNNFGVIYIADNGDLRFQSMGTHSPEIVLHSSSNGIDITGIISSVSFNGSISINTGSVVGFGAIPSTDSGLSRFQGNGIAVGNGNPGDFSGTLKLGNEILTAAAPTVAASQVGFGSTTATSANAGANGDVPAQVLGYLIANVAGTTVKIPYYAN